MSFKTIITSAAISAITVGSLLPMASAANAREWNGRGARAGHIQKHSFNVNRPSVNRWGDVRHNRWSNSGRDYSHGYRMHRDHSGRNLAIGAFAAILGLAIAAETAKVQHDYYDND
jgi:hypothetical protein